MIVPESPLRGGLCSFSASFARDSSARHGCPLVGHKSGQRNAAHIWHTTFAATSNYAGSKGVLVMGEIRGQLSENLLEPEDFWAVDRHGLGLKVRPSLVPKLQLFDYRAVREAMLITRHLPPAAKPTF